MDTPTPGRARLPERGLTADELEIAGLLARGLRCPEIAAQLGVSDYAVRSRVKAASTKLRLRNARNLAAWARAGGAE